MVEQTLVTIDKQKYCIPCAVQYTNPIRGFRPIGWYPSEDSIVRGKCCKCNCSGIQLKDENVK